MLKEICSFFYKGGFPFHANRIILIHPLEMQSKSRTLLHFLCLRLLLELCLYL